MHCTSSNAELFPVFGESRLFPGEHALYYRKRDALVLRLVVFAAEDKLLDLECYR